MTSSSSPGRFPPGFPLLLCLLVFGQSGCLEQSDDLLLGGPLPALATDAGTQTGTASPEWRSGTPSLAGTKESPWSRQDWASTSIVIPMASVRHQPTYVDPALPGTGTTTAGRTVPPGSFPTAKTALTVEVDRGDVLFSGVLAPFEAALDLVVAPVQMICSPPCAELEGPTADWTLLSDAAPVTMEARP